MSNTQPTIFRNGTGYGGGITVNSGGSPWIENIPEMHRNIFRGQSLGNSVTTAQLSAIDNGTFENLYIGDYWTISVTIDGTTTDVNWRIADINYWKNTQNNENIPNHLAIVPDNPLYDAKMFNSSYNDYTQSIMYTTNINAARTAISSIFESNILTHKTQLGTSDTTYSDSTIDLMTLLMVFGYVSQGVNETKVRTVDNKQLALFRLAPEYINIDPTKGYWTRDVCQNNTAGEVYHGRVGMGSDSEIIGVKPIFAIGTPVT